jgi:cytochrome c553
MTGTLKRLIMLTGLLAINSQSLLKADTIDTSGQAVYEQCGYCHEYDGNSVMPGFPKLAGQQTDYLEKQLKDFRAGRRTGTMQGTAELLDDDAITEVAQYFSGQTLRSQHPQKPEQHTAARQLYLNGDPGRGITGCASCHGEQAQGRGAVPRLAGQHAAYLKQELQRFTAQARTNDPGGIMRNAVRGLKNEEIEALADLLAGWLEPGTAH